jgi:hypothetical protein
MIIKGLILEDPAVSTIQQTRSTRSSEPVEDLGGWALGSRGGPSLEVALFPGPRPGGSVGYVPPVLSPCVSFCFILSLNVSHP